MDYGKLIKKAVVLDFDGTMCRLFEHYDLHHVKLELQDELFQYGVRFWEEDCFEVYKVISDQISDNYKKKNALVAADRIIVKAECEAVATGMDVEGLTRFFDWCKVCGVELGIATNNSEACIKKYLLSRGIDDSIPIVGRQTCHPERMKPNPWTLNRVINKLGVDRESILFIGDNPTDYLCAVAAKVDFIGIASTEKKKKRFERFHNSILVKDNYYEIIDSLCLKQ